TRPELRTGVGCPCQLLYVTLLVRRRSWSGVHAESHGSRSTRGGIGSVARRSTQRSGGHFVAVQPGQGGDRARVCSLNTTQSKGHPGSQLVRMFLSPALRGATDGGNGACEVSARIRSPFRLRTRPVRPDVCYRRQNRGGRRSEPARRPTR